MEINRNPYAFSHKPLPVANQWREVCWRLSEQTLGEKSEFTQDRSLRRKGPVFEIRSRIANLCTAMSPQPIYVIYCNIIYNCVDHTHKNGPNNVTFSSCYKYLCWKIDIKICLKEFNVLSFILKVDWKIGIQLKFLFFLQFCDRTVNLINSSTIQILNTAMEW